MLSWQHAVNFLGILITVLRNRSSKPPCPDVGHFAPAGLIIMIHSQTAPHIPKSYPEMGQQGYIVLTTKTKVGMQKKKILVLIDL